jgi:hypothetical protein
METVTENSTEMVSVLNWWIVSKLAPGSIVRGFALLNKH